MYSSVSDKIIEKTIIYSIVKRIGDRVVFFYKVLNALRSHIFSDYILCFILFK